MWHRRLGLVLLVLLLGALPSEAQQTLEIPRAQFEGLRDVPVPEITVPDGTAEGLLRAMEDAVRLDWTDSLPEAVTEQLLGALPFEAHAKVVWEMQVTGDWSERVSGEGTLSVLDQSELGRGGGRQFTAILDSDTREWPFHLFAFVPPEAPDVGWTSFSGPGDVTDGLGGTGFSAITNHMFQDVRTIGYATPQGMRTTRFTEGSLVDEYYYTKVEGGRIRVDSGENAYRIHFSANVREYHRRDDSHVKDEPSGRFASLRGWVCEAAAYAADPDSCLYDDFQVVDHTPINQRHNVNSDYPTITVTFSDPVDLGSLAASFTLFTVNAVGQPVKIDGHWRESPYIGAWRDEAMERVEAIAPQFGEIACTSSNLGGIASHRFPPLQRLADPREYLFEPVTRLRSGTLYEARIKGGEEGVRMQHADLYLEQDLQWHFSTLLTLAAQPPVDQDEALELHVYQPVRDPDLVKNKPAMVRLYPDWRAHEDIAASWQPERFEFELALLPHHPRAVAQRGARARYDRLAWLEPRRAFQLQDRSVQHIRHHTEDTRHARNTVNFFGWLPQGAEQQLELDACPHDPFPHVLPDAVASTKKPLRHWDHDPGQLSFHYVLAEIGPWADRIPPAATQMMMRTMGLGERYIPQFLPYRSARAVPTNIGFGSYGMFLAGLRDPGAGLKRRAGIMGGLDGDYATTTHVTAYVRWLQRILRDSIAPDDIVVVFLPQGTLVDAQGLAPTGLTSFFFTGELLDYGSRVALLQIPSGEPGEGGAALNADLLAMALMHEFGHELSLRHVPHDYVPHLDPRGYFEAGIEAFRLHPSGLDGWNKSEREGNAEREDMLLSLMWPQVAPTDALMLRPEEHAAMQRSIEAGFRQRSAWLPQSGMRFAQNALVQSDAAPVREDRLVISGLLDPEGEGALLDPLRTRAVAANARSDGSAGGVADSREEAYAVELLDPKGRVLRHAAFTPEEPALAASALAASEEEALEDLGLWPEFYVSLVPHPEASTLVIRKGGEEVVRLEPAGATVSLRLASDEPLEFGRGSASVSWSSDGAEAVVFDVEYSPNGEAPWQILSLHQEEAKIEIDADVLSPGPRPQLRITAQSGLHGTSKIVPVTLLRSSEPLTVDLPDPEAALQGAPIMLEFAAPVDPDVLSRHLRFGSGGERMEVKYLFLPDRNTVSLLPLEPLQPGTEYSLHLGSGFHTAYGAPLAEPGSWRFTTAAASPATD